MSIPKSVYYRTYIGLLLLLIATALAAQFNLGVWNTVLALGIAGVKAALVLLFFMHLRYSADNKSVWLAAGVGFFWLGILFVLALSDYLARGYFPVPGK